MIATVSLSTGGGPDRLGAPAPPPLSSPPAFQPAALAHPVEGSLRSLALADLDGDGLGDVVTLIGPEGGASDPRLEVRQGRPGGRLADPLVLPAGGMEDPGALARVPSSAHLLNIVDLNGDSRPDILKSQPVEYYLNLADGRFSHRPLGGCAAAPLDFDRDGVTDLAVAHVDIPLDSPDALFLGIRIYRGAAEGMRPVLDVPLFDLDTLPGYAPTGIAAGDHDGDGVTDLLVASTGDDPYVRNGLILLRGMPGGRFAPPQMVADGVVAADPALVDLDQDGAASDLAYRTEEGGFTLDAPGPASLSALTGAEALNDGLFVDLDRDGGLDLLGLNDHGILLHHGERTGLGEGRLIQVGGFFALAAGDLDGDGRIDLAGAAAPAVPDDGAATPRERDLIILALQDRAGRFGTPVQPAGAALRLAQPADLDGDGRIDLVALTDGPEATLLSFTGDGAGRLEPAAERFGQVTLGGAAADLRVADLDGDRRPEVIAAEEEGDVVLIRPGPAGRWQIVGRSQAGARPSRLELADFNADRRIDLAVLDGGDPGSEGGGSVRLLLGGPDGRLEDGREVVQLPPPLNPAPPGGAEPGMSPPALGDDLLAGDFTADGRADLVVAGRDRPSPDGSIFSAVWIFPGRGDGRFGPGVEIAAGPFGTVRLVALDADADGEVDLILTGSAGDTFTLFNRGGDFRLRLEGPPSGDARETRQPELVAADVTADGHQDLLEVGAAIRVVPRERAGGAAAPEDDLLYFAGDLATASRSRVAAADLDGDGRADLVVPNRLGLGVLRGNAGILARDEEEATDGRIPGGIDLLSLSALPATGDLDGDGVAEGLLRFSLQVRDQPAGLFQLLLMFGAGLPTPGGARSGPGDADVHLLARAGMPGVAFVGLPGIDQLSRIDPEARRIDFVVPVASLRAAATRRGRPGDFESGGMGRLTLRAWSRSSAASDSLPGDREAPYAFPLGKVSLPLSASGGGPEFGTVAPDAPDTIRLSLGNEGLTPVRLEGVSLSGSGFPDGLYGPIWIGALSSAPIDLPFGPAPLGRHTGNLLVDGRPVEIGVSVDRPIVEVSPESLDFAAVPPGWSSSRSLVLSSPSLPGHSVPALVTVSVAGGAFSTAMNGRSFALFPGTTRALPIVFAPREIRPYAESLVLETNDPVRSRLEVRLRGVGVEPSPRIRIQPDRFDLGYVAMGIELWREISIINAGTAPLSGLITPPRGPSPFGIMGLFGFTVSPGERRHGMVLFRAEGAGITSADVLTVTSNDPDRPYVEVPVSGTGAWKGVSLKPSTTFLDFGAVPPGGLRTLALTIVNQGLQTAEIRNASVRGEAFSSPLASPRLGTFETVETTVTFSPPVPGDYSGLLTFSDNAGKSFTINLAGRGE